MNKIISIFLLSVVFIFASCSTEQGDTEQITDELAMATPSEKATGTLTEAVGDVSETIVIISTDYGDMKVKLYNETPQHRDNFIKLAKEGFYDGTLFHRVISGFMIQGGDPASKTAVAGQGLGSGGPGYTIPAEFDTKFIHKKGALSAARTGGPSNPLKASSGSQFYVVQGQVTPRAQLEQMVQQKNQQKKQQFFNEMVEGDPALKEKVMVCQQNNDQEGFRALIDSITPIIDTKFAESGTAFTYTEEQLVAYETIGGTPHLDTDYTVFGEVIEGLDIIDKIAAVEVGEGNRPNMDVKMTIKVIE